MKKTLIIIAVIIAGCILFNIIYTESQRADKIEKECHRKAKLRSGPDYCYKTIKGCRPARSYEDEYQKCLRDSKM